MDKKADITTGVAGADQKAPENVQIDETPLPGGQVQDAGTWNAGVFDEDDDALLDEEAQLMQVRRPNPLVEAAELTTAAKAIESETKDTNISGVGSPSREGLALETFLQTEAVGAVGDVASSSLPIPTHTEGAEQQSESIFAMDYESRKLQIPLSAVVPTKGTQRGGCAALCVLYGEGKCRRGAECNQVHAQATVVARLREEAARITDCCAFHGDPAGDALLRQCHSPIFHTLEGIRVSGIAIPRNRIAFTIGLLRSFEKHLQDDAGETNASQPPSTTVAASESFSGELSIQSDNAAPSAAVASRKKAVAATSIQLSVTFVCRLHAAGHCRFGPECRFAHICKDLCSSTLAQVVQPMVSSLDRTRTAKVNPTTTAVVGATNPEAKSALLGQRGNATRPTLHSSASSSSIPSSGQSTPLLHASITHGPVAATALAPPQYVAYSPGQQGGMAHAVYRLAPAPTVLQAESLVAHTPSEFDGNSSTMSSSGASLIPYGAQFLPAPSWGQQPVPQNVVFNSSGPTPVRLAQQGSPALLPIGMQLLPQAVPHQPGVVTQQQHGPIQFYPAGVQGAPSGYQQIPVHPGQPHAPGRQDGGGGSKGLVFPNSMGQPQYLAQPVQVLAVNPDPDRGRPSPHQIIIPSPYGQSGPVVYNAPPQYGLMVAGGYAPAPPGVAGVSAQRTFYQPPIGYANQGDPSQQGGGAAFVDPNTGIGYRIVM
jgi:hypothetical protein